MTEYIYKGFYIAYEVGSSRHNLYKADGKVAKQEKKQTTMKKFHTEYPTKRGAEEEIRKLIEKYVDFEWKEFHETQ